MLGFDKFFENKTLMISAGAVAFLAAALLILFIIRLAFHRRLHMPGGGRARQPRLGVVDAFDLDRQRQLVIVRRDNVEHLVMIGGPNDVLIESQIVRAEARETPRQRDKEPTVAPLAWPGATAVPVPGQPQQPPSIAPEPKHLPVPEAPVPVAAKEALPPSVAPNTPLVASVPVPPAVPQGPGTPAPATPGGRPPFLPLPPRRTTPLPPLGVRPPPAASTAPAGTLENPSVEGAPAPVGPAPRAPNSPPAFLRTPRPLSTPTLPSAPSVSPPGPSPIAPTVVAPPVTPLPPRPAEVLPPKPPVPEIAVAPKPVVEPELQSTDAIESLEEEMAKLLGRDTQRS